MKVFFLILAAWILASAIDARASEITGQCVFPAGIPAEIKVYDGLTPASLGVKGKIGFSAYKVGQRQGNKIGLYTTKDITLDGKGGVSDIFVGWVNREDMDVVAFRNCT